MNSQTERLTLQGEAGHIEVLRDTPDGVSKGVAIVAHPHPLFGGTMDNKVVQTLARAFVQCGWTVVRFNFRGVGASAGEHDAGNGEARDFCQVVAHVAAQGPLAIAGFSFGSFVASHAVQTLWSARSIEKVVFVGTAAQRFTVAPLPTELHDKTLVVLANKMTPCLWPRSWIGPDPKACPSPWCPVAAISFMDNCPC